VAQVTSATTKSTEVLYAERLLQYKRFQVTPERLQHTKLGRTGPLGSLALAGWAGWSCVQVGRHVKCWRRKGDGEGDPAALT